jgi:hypothetical protein
MDLSDDFPNNKVHDAQAIIQRLNSIIKDIESRRAAINRMQNDIDNEGTKLDFIVKNIHEIKQSMIGDYQLKSVMAELERKLDVKLQMMNRVASNPPSEPDEESNIPTIAVSVILGFSIGVIFGFFMRR